MVEDLIIIGHMAHELQNAPVRFAFVAGRIACGNAGLCLSKLTLQSNLIADGHFTPSEEKKNAARKE
jgi:hypothetical protein